MRFRLAHLSDVHLGPLPSPSIAELFSKRIFGYLNWIKNRRGAMGREVLDALVADMTRQAPDHVAVTGDLVNIATRAEFDAARTWLEALGDPARVSLVLGNHDAYVPGAARVAAAVWAPWLGVTGPARLPALRRIGPVALFGISTAVATPPFHASGRVGVEQLSALAAMLDRNDDAFKIVLMHHPPDADLSRGRRGLADVAAVREVLAAGCVDLVLHGHTHEPSLRFLATPRGRAAVVGVPSATSNGSRHAPAGYALIDIGEDGFVLTRRAIDPESRRIRRVSVEEIALRSARFGPAT